MKILCISDQVDPLVYSNSIKERFNSIDIVLCAGDLPMEYIDFIVSSLNKPMYFIFGNHNLSDFKYYQERGEYQAYSMQDSMSMSHFHGGIYIDSKCNKIGNLLIAGMSGSLRYNRGQNQFTDKQMFFKLLKLTPTLFYNKFRYGRYLDIFLTHSPPLGIHDKQDPCHMGFNCYRWFLEKFKPKYMIHGHIHLYDLHDERVTVYKNTTIINAYSHYILEV